MLLTSSGLVGQVYVSFACERKTPHSPAGKAQMLSCFGPASAPGVYGDRPRAHRRRDLLVALLGMIRARTIRVGSVLGAVEEAGLLQGLSSWAEPFWNDASTFTARLSRSSMWNRSTPLRCVSHQTRAGKNHSHHGQRAGGSPL